MKKYISLFFTLLLSTFVFCLDNEQYLNYLRNNCEIWCVNENVNGAIYYKTLHLYDDVFLLFQKGKYSVTAVATDGKTFARDVAANYETAANFQVPGVALFIADFDYDGKDDLITINIGDPDSTYLYIYSVYKDKDLLQVEMLHYSLREYKLAWINYCIVNGKRGIRFPVRGKKLSKSEYYYLAGDIDDYNVYGGNGNSLAFYYWSPEEGRYIPDQSVTQDQLKNASCPEDYFAYNGLKFSKLSSKLTEADLKDLDKAQLRLMRNAVYARHGRTFKSVDLQSLWECYTWYEKNPNYSDDLLTETDKYNIELVQKFEAKK